LATLNKEKNYGDPPHLVKEGSGHFIKTFDKEKKKKKKW
jgi:hypothetical protein